MNVGLQGQIGMRVVSCLDLAVAAMEHDSVGVELQSQPIRVLPLSFARFDLARQFGNRT